MRRHRELNTTGKAGVFNYYKTVYCDGDEALYAPVMGDGYAKSKNKGSYYRTKWRTYSKCLWTS